MDCSVVRKKIFMRVLSGFKVAEYRGETVRFLTLTSSPVTTDGLSWEEKYEFLKMQLANLFKSILREFKVKIEYIKVVTDEGFGVVHVLFRDLFIPHGWLVDEWYRLTGAFIVDIRIPKGNAWDAARYVSSQYLGSQNCSFMKYMCSQGWIFKSFVGVWSWLRSRCRHFDRGYMTVYGTYCWPVNRELLFSSWDRVLRRVVFDNWEDCRHLVEFNDI